MATESGGDETGDETGDPRDETHEHVMQHIIKILFYFIKILFTNRFSQFLLQKISNKQAINVIQNINKMFYKTIWILTFFS